MITDLVIRIPAIKHQKFSEFSVFLLMWYQSLLQSLIAFVRLSCISFWHGHGRINQINHPWSQNFLYFASNGPYQGRNKIEEFQHLTRTNSEFTGHRNFWVFLASNIRNHHFFSLTFLPGISNCMRYS